MIYRGEYVNRSYKTLNYTCNELNYKNYKNVKYLVVIITNLCKSTLMISSQFRILEVIV